MKKLLLLFALFLAVSASAQLGVRVDRSIIRPENNVSRFLIYDTGTINVCANPANGVPCTNKVTTYTDDTLGTPCSTATQVVWAETNTCVSGTDSFGDWGVWVPGGQYTYTITYPDGSSEGPFPFTAGSGSTAAAAHNLLSTVHLDTTPATVQRGDLVIGQGVSPKWARKAIGAAGTALCSDGTDANWGTCFANALIQQIVPPRTDLSYAIIYPTNYAAYGGPTAYGQSYGGVSSGYITRFHSVPLGDLDVWMSWNGFSLPAAISPSSVQYIYAVFISSSNFNMGNHNVQQCQGSIVWETGAYCTGSGSGSDILTSGQFNLLVASGGAAASYNYAGLTLGATNVDSLSENGNDTWNLSSVAIVVFYSGTQVPLANAIQVVPPLYYNKSLNTLSWGTSTLPPPVGKTNLPTTLIASGSCSTALTTNISGVTANDVVVWSFASDSSGVTGYGASASGHLDIYPYATTNNVNFKVCNSTAGGITPSAMAINWTLSPK